MEKDSSSKILTLKIALYVLLAVLILGGLALVSYNAYYWKNVAPKYESVSTTYADSFTFSETEKYPIELNYYTNELNNGVEVFEIRVSSYMDTKAGDSEGIDFKNIYGYGLQIVGKPVWKEKDGSRERHYNWGFLGIGGGYSVQMIPSGSNAFYYNTDAGGTSYSETSKLGIDSTAWIIDFDGEIGQMKQKNWVGKNVNPIIAGYEINSNPNSNDRTSRIFHEKLDVFSLIRTLYETTRSLRNGIDVLQFDLSKWFTGFHLTEDGKKFEENASAHQNWLFANVKVNRSPNGMVVASQSIFGKVEKKADWSLSGYSPVDYWRTNTVYSLSIADFEYIPCATGFNAKLKQNAFDYLRNFNNMQFALAIDISNSSLVNAGINLVGFDIDAFRGLPMHSVMITSAFPTTFNTPIAIPNISLVNVTLIVGGGT